MDDIEYSLTSLIKSNTIENENECVGRDNWEEEKKKYTQT